MSVEQAVYPRGKLAGVFPTLTNRSDEAYVEFIDDARKILIHAQQEPIGAYSRGLIDKSELSNEDNGPENTQAAIELLMQDSVLKTYYRVKRSLQDAFWSGLKGSLDVRRDEILAALNETDKAGPGTLEYDPNWADSVPEYADCEIHLQPGGNMSEALAGLYYDSGLKVFLGGAADNDQMAKFIAMGAAMPDDGQVERILDLGVGPGSSSTALKEKHPDAEVWAIDLGAPMVRYAHLRAIEANADVHFRQMAAEDLDFPDNHFDAALAVLLFHELPIPVSKEVIAEVYRVLRPGGKFTLLDFPGSKTSDLYSMFFAQMDALDNVEPYLPEYRRSNVEDLLVEAGFELDGYDPKAALSRGRIAVKPATA
jgi:ubiquinone/menaquinone biosynthesis C-methylase UbiE